MIDRKLLKDGDIFLFHTKGFSPISMAIRKLTQSFWNHAGMYYEIPSGEGYIIEALGRGVVETPIDNFLEEKTHIVKVVRLKVEAFKDQAEYDTGIATAVGRMKEEIGKRYDFWAIAWLGFKYIFKGSYKKAREYIPIGNPLQSREKFFCSEIITEATWSISSIYKYPNLFAGKKYHDAATTTPGDISKSENVFIISGTEAR